MEAARHNWDCSNASRIAMLGFVHGLRHTERPSRMQATSLSATLRISDSHEFLNWSVNARVHKDRHVTACTAHHEIKPPRASSTVDMGAPSCLLASTHGCQHMTRAAQAALRD